MTHFYAPQNEVAADTADLLLAEAQLIRAKDSVQDLTAIAGGYATLAVAHQLASLTETVDALAELVEDLADAVTATRRTPWWKALLSWRPGRRKAATSSFDDAASQALSLTADAQDAPVEVESAPEGADLADVITFPFAGGAR
ncbi:hypothetical protein [Actinocorallia populi]|uniref:hypothetical protein n=1 Tax=Actinocorallia populi TaxID=2079200 RepID=UPI000D088A50|nr:hypothetical protein [Actinocorallia populi]